MRLQRFLRLEARRDDDGFSLIELAVAIGIFSIVMAVIFATVLNTMNAANSFQERTQEQADTRLAVDLLVRDFRQAYQTPGTPSVEVMTATTIRFYSPDREPDFHLRKIEYNLAAGGVLTRSEATSSNTFSLAVTGGAGWAIGGMSPVVPVLTGIINTTVFTYMDQSSPPLTTAIVASMRSVVIDLVIDQSPNTSPTRQTYHTQVNLRVT
jgi:prepilin-type N-terminal cleavage/methylation domain-containing protein